MTQSNFAPEKALHKMNHRPPKKATPKRSELAELAVRLNLLQRRIEALEHQFYEHQNLAIESDRYRLESLNGLIERFHGDEHRPGLAARME